MTLNNALLGSNAIDITAPAGILTMSIYNVAKTTYGVAMSVHSDPNDVEYQIYKNGAGQGWQDSNLFVETGMSAGDTDDWTFKVRDKSNNQNETSLSNVFTFGTETDAVTDLDDGVVTTSGQIPLSWSAITGAKDYEVFYRVNGDTSWIDTDTYVVGTSHTMSLSVGTNYDFMIRVRNTNNFSSANSNVLTNIFSGL